jgi:ferredoxin--NADP+ reductase
VQAAFTTPELQELGELVAADVVVDPADLELDEGSAVALAGEGQAIPRRNVELLRDYAGRARTDRPRSVHLRFLVSPVELRGEGRVEEVVVVRNRLEAGPDGTLRAVPTGELETIPCGLVLRSVGYRGTPLDGVPFDDRRALIPNDRGRVVDDEGRVVAGEYCAGWIKRGPSGVIGTNKKDATESVEVLLADAEAGLLAAPPEPSPEAIERLVAERAPAVVEYAGWQAIDEHERGLGSPAGRPRVKLTSWDELLRHGSRVRA